MPRLLFALLIAALISSECGVEAYPAAPHVIAPLIAGDEPVVVTEHQIETPGGPLIYEARAGRLPIRVDETGEVHARVFFVAYVVKNRGENRPLTVAWNGGPTIPSIYVHTEFIGPRRLTPNGFIDNPLTLLTKSDLVFYDPVETGFSRVEKPEFAPEFFNMKGDIGTAGEFVRAYRARFDAQSQPLFILGESYGVWRAAGVAEFLEERGLKVDGLMLISGGFPSTPMPMSFWNAMNVQNHVATALYYKRLDPELMSEPSRTMRTADAWVRSTYLPALERAPKLSDAERRPIRARLAEFTGVRVEDIDPVTLVMNTNQFLTGFFGGDPKRVLADVDTRRFGEEPQSPGRHLFISRYLRNELGYATDLGYTGELGYGSDLEYRALEAGYVPTPGPERRSSGKQWLYNQTPDAAAANAKGRKDGEVAHTFNVNPAWTQVAMTLQPELRVFVALGRYDPTNTCEGERQAVATLKPEFTRRITIKCYDAGHMMYRDEAERVKVSDDLRAFVTGAAALNASPR